MRSSIYILLSCCLSLLPGCEKVINIDLNNNSGQYVIEGEISDHDMPSTVKISKSTAFNASNNFEAVDNALVIISDNTGITDTLLPQSGGIYKTKSIRGAEGRIYSLKVMVDGYEFSAQSIMPKAVPFDTLFISQSSDGIQYLVPVYKDDPNEKNYYRFNTLVNGKQTRYINVRNDELTNGNIVTDPLLAGFATGDTMTVQMLCIDKNNFTYFYSLDQIAGFGETATPANPVSNISGRCLGFFSAHTLQERTIIIR